MIRGWYYNRNLGQRLLSVNEIARASSISTRQITKWLADDRLKRALTNGTLVDAGEMVSFLIRKGLPVSTLLHPPKTKKILFIAQDECEIQDNAEKCSDLCRFFADTCNILIETSIAGRYADLSILTFSPNLVVMFLNSYDQESANTINLLSSFPDLKIILFVGDLIKNDVARDLAGTRTHHLIINKELAIDDFIPQLRRIFDN